jgi:hypothetical protein
LHRIAPNGYRQREADEEVRMADYDDYDEILDDGYDTDRDDTRMSRRRGSRGGSGGGGGGLSREERFTVTLGAAGALMLVIGLTLGFALGRVTAPKATQPAPIITVEATGSVVATQDVTPIATDTVESTVTEVADATASVEATPADTKAPKTPNQLAPDDGDRIDADKVSLRWSKVTDDSGVTYAFEIQNYLGSSKWGNGQVIDDLHATTYKVRVLSVRRRWRVWSVDGVGNKSGKSDWSYFGHTVVKSSTTSSGTAN